MPLRRGRLIGVPEITTGMIAKRLARARHDLGWTLVDAANYADISVAHLSRIERGSRQPSIGLLIQLARAYQLSLGQLVGEEPHATSHVTRHDAGPTYEGPGGLYTPLSGLIGQHLLEAVRLDLQPRASTSKDAAHAGEEWLYVLDGEISLLHGADVIELARGDTAHLDAQVPHHLHNSSDQHAQVLLVTGDTRFGKSNSHYPLPPDDNEAVAGEAL